MPSAHVVGTALCDEPETGASVLRIETDLPERCRAFYVPATVQPPATGDTVSWDTGHATIGGQVVRKIGYSFDPDAGLS